MVGVGVWDGVIGEFAPGDFWAVVAVAVGDWFVLNPYVSPVPLGAKLNTVPAATSNDEADALEADNPKSTEGGGAGIV